MLQIGSILVDMQNELPLIWFRLLVFDQDKEEKKYNEKKTKFQQIAKKNENKQMNWRENGDFQRFEYFICDFY